MSQFAVWSWGYNEFGQLGNGMIIYYTNRPVHVVDLSGVSAVAAGWYHSLALKSDGTVWAWGANWNGPLGNGTVDDTNRPVQVIGLSNIVTIAAGYDFSMAMDGNSVVWVWGRGWEGGLDNGISGYTTEPTPVSGLTGVTKIAGGAAHFLAIKNNGTAWAWGANWYGQLGNGQPANSAWWNTTNRPGQVVDITNVSDISSGGGYNGIGFSLALKNDGTVWAWGENDFGALGDGTFTDRNCPVQVVDLTGVSAVEAGGDVSLALQNDGTIWSWGANGFGQRGDGTMGFYDFTNRPVHVVDLTGVSAIAAGAWYSLGLKNNGTVWSWGNNWWGQLGDGTGKDYTNRPVQVVDLTGMSAIAGGDYHALALKSDGTVWAWGNGSYGKLGNGMSMYVTNRPVQVVDLSGVSSISAGLEHSLALRNDGTVWVWGDNTYGQLGNGTRTGTNRPIQVIGLTNAIAISAGRYSSMAVLPDGSLVSWGDNTYGQLGHSILWYQVLPISILLEHFAPDRVTASDGTYTDKVQVTWNTVTDATAYEIWRNTNNASASAGRLSNNLTDTTYDDTSTAAGITYYYWVIAKNATQTSEFSNPDTGYLALPAPTGVSASDGTYSNKVRVIWNAITNAASYEVWRNTSNDSSSATNLPNEPSAATYDDSSVTVGTTNYYWVKAKNGPATSTFSASDSGYAASSPGPGPGPSPGPSPSVVCADYDGDRLADPAVYDETTGTWKVKLSSANYYLVITTLNGLGGPGYASVSADYDGDAKADPAVYRESSGVWTILKSSLNYIVWVFPSTLGGTGYSGMPADYDGDRLADPGVYQRDRGDWKVLLSSAGYYQIELLGFLGGTGYRAVAADYDGDRLADPAIYGESNGYWIFKLSSIGYVEIVLTQPLGGAGYIPVPANYDGDGLTDPAVKSESGDEWIAMLSSAGYTPVHLTILFE